jgi:hypothetical protein
MNAASALRDQEAGWFDTSLVDKGSVSKLPGNARSMANSFPATFKSQGASNTAPISTSSIDTTEVALAAIVSALASSFNNELDEVSEVSLSSIAPGFNRYDNEFLSSHVEKSAQILRLHPLIDRDSAMPTWLTTDKVIASLLGVCTLLGGALLSVVLYIHAVDKADVDELKKDTKEIARQSADSKIELVKAIGAVREQTVGIAARLDQLILDGRQRR